MVWRADGVFRDFAELLRRRLELGVYGSEDSVRYMLLRPSCSMASLLSGWLWSTRTRGLKRRRLTPSSVTISNGPGDRVQVRPCFRRGPPAGASPRAAAPAPGRPGRLRDHVVRAEKGRRLVPVGHDDDHATGERNDAE